MSNSHLLILKEPAIWIILGKAKRIVAELDYYRRHEMASTEKVLTEKTIEKNQYIKLMFEMGSITNGIPCYRCRSLIKPNSYCYSKMKSRRVVRIPFYYHQACFEELYH